MGSLDSYGGQDLRGWPEKPQRKPCPLLFPPMSGSWSIRIGASGVAWAPQNPLWFNARMLVEAFPVGLHFGTPGYLKWFSVSIVPVTALDGRVKYYRFFRLSGKWSGFHALGNTRHFEIRALPPCVSKWHWLGPPRDPKNRNAPSGQKILLSITNLPCPTDLKLTPGHFVPWGSGKINSVGMPESNSRISAVSKSSCPQFHPRPFSCGKWREGVSNLSFMPIYFGPNLVYEASSSS